jgi:hypothetical protein
MASVAAEPFPFLHMNPMSDVLTCNQLLVAHLGHLMPCFVLSLRKVWQVSSKCQAKVMVFIQL